MNYKDINDKWKTFLAENTFKEDIVIRPEKKKKRKKDKKEIIVSEKEKCMDEGSGCMEEWEEFQNEDEKSLEETSTVSGGSVEGGSGSPFISMEDFKDRWKA